MEVVALDASLRPWAEALTAQYFASGRIASRGRLHDVSELEGLVAVRDGEPVGYLGYFLTGDECEIVVLVSAARREGVARALVESLAEKSAEMGVVRLVLVTTNDNVSAQRFYEACGFALAATHAGAVAAARAVKPEIPLLGEGGIAIVDELEFARFVARG